MAVLMRENRLRILRNIKEKENSTITDIKRIMNESVIPGPTASGLLSILNLFEEVMIIKTKIVGRTRISKITKKRENILKLLEIIEKRTTLS